MFSRWLLNVYGALGEVFAATACPAVPRPRSCRNGSLRVTPTSVKTPVMLHPPVILRCSVTVWGTGAGDGQPWITKIFPGSVRVR